MRKFMAMALALLMVCVMLPVVAMADDTVNSEESLKNAINAVSAGGTITLDGDISLTSTLTIAADKEFTIDFNGKTINNNSAFNGYLIKNSGKVTFTNGKVADSRTNQTGTMTAIDNIGTLTLNNMEMSRGAGIVVKNDENNGSPYGILYVNNTTITVGTPDVTLGRGQAIQNWGDVTINGGTFNGDVNTWAYPGCHSGKTTIKAGTVNGSVQSIQWKATEWPTTAAETVIEGGSVTGTVAILYQEGSAQPTTSAADVPEDIVKAAFSITGGTFTDKENAKKYIPEGKTINSNGTVVDKTITIIVPSEGGSTTTTTTPDTTKNPSTGANDFVGVAAAAAVMALLGSAVVLRKK